jgi:hypothetical protein
VVAPPIPATPERACGAAVGVWEVSFTTALARWESDGRSRAVSASETNGGGGGDVVAAELL